MRRSILMHRHLMFAEQPGQQQGGGGQQTGNQQGAEQNGGTGGQQGGQGAESGISQQDTGGTGNGSQNGNQQQLAQQQPDQAAVDKAAADQAAADRGYPMHTPVENMSDAQRAAYWREHAQKHEKLWKVATTDPHEVQRNIDSARADGRREASLAAVPTVIATAVGDRLTTEQLSLHVGLLDASKFLTADGQVDTAKVTAYVGTIAPAGTGRRRDFPDMGQGHRESGKRTGVAAGRDLYRERHGSKDKDTGTAS